MVIGQRQERENPVTLQLLDDVVTSSIGPLSQLSKSVLNSILNYHRVEAVHATSIALDQHQRAQASRRVCDDVAKELGRRKSGKRRDDKAMDVVEETPTAPEPVPSEDVDIPDANPDSSSEGEEVKTPVPGASGYHSA